MPHLLPCPCWSASTSFGSETGLHSTPVLWRDGGEGRGFTARAAKIGVQSSPFMPAERQSRWHAASEPLAESAMMRTGGALTEGP